MKSEKQLFGITLRQHLFAVIEAADEDEARERISLARDVAYIPDLCDIAPLAPHMWLKTPVFYEADFEAMEDRIASYLEEHAAQYP